MKFFITGTAGFMGSHLPLDFMNNPIPKPDLIG